ncbi:Putative quinone oxidoreductase [Mycobacteroides abscessus]|nr:Putative quinone oxidoreductase [Mycobacteroides abscessus]
MAYAVRIHETGGPEVLRGENVQVGAPGPGEVRIRHHAVGLNFADVYFRTGVYPVALPAGMGVAGSGIIEAVGPAYRNSVRGTASPTRAARWVLTAPSA